MSQNEWTGPGVRDLGDEIEVDVADVRRATLQLARIVEGLSEDVVTWGEKHGPVMRMPKLLNPSFPPWGKDPYGDFCGDPIDICSKLEEIIRFLRMICEGVKHQPTSSD